MGIKFLGTPNFELQELLISLGIPRDSWVIQNHVFRKTREVNPINPLFKSESFIKQYFEGQEWQKLDLSIQTWDIYYKDPISTDIDSMSRFNAMLKFIDQIYRLKEDVKLIDGISHVIEEFKHEVKDWHEEAKATEEIYSRASDYAELVQLSLMSNFWSHFWKSSFSAKSLPSFQKLFRENHCYPLDCFEGEIGSSSLLEKTDLVCNICGRDDSQVEVIYFFQEKKAWCLACYVHDYFLRLSAQTKTYIEQIISDQGRMSEKELSSDKKLPLYPTLSTWNISTPDFQRWFMEIRGVSNLPGMILSQNTNRIKFHDDKVPMSDQERMKKELQAGIEKYVIVLEKIRANSRDDIAAFLTLDNELWINLPNDIFLKITPHPVIPRGKQVLVCHREDFYRVLKEEILSSTYSRSKLTDENLYFLAYYIKYEAALGYTFNKFFFERWFIYNSKKFEDLNNGYLRSSSDMWMVNSNALSTTFLKNEGFKIITPNELILNTWDTLIVKEDDTKTEFPYDSDVEYSLKLLCPSDYSDLPPLIFFKPDYPLIFKPPKTNIFICIDPKGIRDFKKDGISGSLHPLFMKYKMTVLNEEKQEWYPEEGQQYLQSRIRYHTQ